MALVLQDRVRVASTTTGTGTITLGAAYDGYRTFASCIPDGSTTYYCIHNTATGFENEWEVGLGTYALGANTLARTTVLSSSNAGAAVNFSAGTKEVFVTYPAEKAIYEEANGETLIDGGPITVIGSGVTVVPTLPAELGKFVGNVNLFAQIYNINQNGGSSASADFVAYNNDTTDGYTHFTDMGINSGNYTSVDYPIFTPGSGYLFHDGDDFFIGNQTANKDVVLFAGGADTTDEAVRISGTDRSVTTDADLNVGGALDVTGAASFGSTVLLNANPTTALQAATKQYVDQLASAGLHIHDPVLVETTGNLTATYAQGGTTFNITDITSGTTVTTSSAHGLAVNDQIWLYSTAGNGLSTNTAYFVYSTPSSTQLTLSLAYGGAQITGLTNASGLSYATRANSGVGATLTNAGAQAALTVDGVALSVGNRVMVRLQTTGYENGVYVVTTVGSGSTNWVLTRATDANKVAPEDPNGVGTGDYFYTQSGTDNAGDSHVLTTEPNTMIIGYTTLTYTQFSGAVTYTGGTNIDITGQTISLTGTVAPTNGGTGVNTVTTGDLLYGSASNTWSKLAAGSAYKSLVMNSSGTNVEWNAVALNQSGAVSGTLDETNGGTGINAYTTGDTLYASGANTLSALAGNTTTTKKFLSQTGTGSASQAPAWEQPAASDITGLAPSATTDTTNASNITSGTLPNARLVSVPNSSLANSSMTINGTSISLGGSGTVTAAAGTLTGSTLASNVTGSSLTGVGTISAGTWNGNVVATTYGGTGLASFTANGVVYASSTSALATGSGLQFDGTNLGVGVTPGTWSTGKTIAVNGAGNAIWSPNTINDIRFVSNIIYNGGYTYAATGYANMYTVGGTNGNCTWWTAPSGTAGAAMTLTQAMTLDASGNLGIGTTSVSNALDITRPNGTATQIRLLQSTLESWQIGMPASVASLTFANSGVEQMRITTSGNVGIGTSSPNANLHVQGTATVDGSIAFNQQLTSTTAYNSSPQSGTMVSLKYNAGGSYAGMGGWSIAKENATDGNYASYFAIHTRANGGSIAEKARISAAGGFSVGTTADPGAGAIYATGNITAYYSDERLKTKTGNIENALEKVKQIETLVYHANDIAAGFGYDATVEEVGVTAQSVQKVQPQVVVPAPIDSQYLTVRYERLVPLLIEAIKELEAQVAELKKGK